MEEKLKIQPKKSSQQSKDRTRQERNETEQVSAMSFVAAMLEAAESVQGAQLAGSISREAIGAIGNQAMLTALSNKEMSDGHAAQVAAIAEGADIPMFDESSPLNMPRLAVAFEPVNIPLFAPASTESVAYGQVEQMAADMMR